MARAPAVLVGSALLLSLLIIASGGPASPLWPAVVIWSIVAARHSGARAAIAGVAGMAIVVLLVEFVAGTPDGRGYVLLGVSIAAAIFATRTMSPMARPARPAIRTASASENASEEEDDAPLEREMGRLLATFRSRAGAERVVLWQLDADGSRLVPTGSDGPRPPTWVETRGDPLGWALTEGIAMQLHRTPAWALPGTRIWVCPVGESAATRRLLTAELPQESDEQRAEEAAAEVAGRLTLIGRLAAERRRGAQERRATEALNRALRTLPQHRTPQALAMALLESARDLAAASGAALADWNEEEGQGTVTLVAGDDGGPRIGSRFGDNQSDAALAAKAGTTLERENGRVAASLIAPGEAWQQAPRAAAFVPLRSGTRVIAIITVWNVDREPLSEAGIAMLSTLAPHAALQMEAAAEYGRMRDRAELDPLTGLRNRRSFDQEMAAETTRFERHGRPLALLVIDIDHFKAVNDTHGHQTGDRVLLEVARTIQAGIRDVDLAARFGGEEFVVLLPETSLNAAIEVAERIRIAVARLDATHLGLDGPIHISIGVASAPESVRAPAELFAAADASLYQAKADGRNQVRAKALRG
jgi:diguanylate cyclase (GGDEF)-like protein